MNELTVCMLTLTLLLGLFLTGIELGFAMAIMGVIGFAYLNSFGAAVDMLANDFFDALSSYGLTVIPLFVLMGQIAFNAGVAKRLYDCAHKFMGHIPGGLAIATVAGATIFKAICGSAAATAATFAGVAVPEMDRYGYSKKLSTGIVAVAGTLGVLLPPSVTLIIFGIVTQVSIGKLFMAGIFPGLIIALFFGGISYGWCKIDPTLGPPSEKSTWKARFLTLPGTMWPIIVFLLIMGGLMKGLFTPTEAGSIGTFAVLLLCVIRRDMNFKGYVKSVRESMRTACMVMLLIASSSVLGHLITVTDLPQIASEWIVALPMHRALIMTLILFIYLVGGSFIDDLAFMILATPICFPAIMKLGYDPIWAGIMIALTVAIGSVIPPVAMCVFIVRNITKVPLGVIYAGCYPFLISLFLCVALLFIFPSLALYLPSVLMK
ncbi:MAG: C4-dicarboxylate ABC transporter permease [Syntrophus sp. (in: bacteria)]|nr:C4-dicarboxylate ABC transporter permease [Syntrophus sp. (in: bacteria)]